MYIKKPTAWQVSLNMKQKKSKSKKEKKELPKIKSEEVQESELEKELEKTNEEEIEFEETGSGISSERVKAPVLEKINELQGIPIRFDGNFNSPRISQSNENEEDGFKYIKNANADEPKYNQKYEHETGSDMHLRSEIENFERRDLFPRKNVGFAGSSEARPVETSFEKYESPERVERENLGKNIFERKEIKYKPSRS